MSAKLFLHLYHGRKHPDLQMDEWGESGPVLGPFEMACSTYATNVRLFTPGHEREVWLVYVKDLVYFRGAYYGDFSLHAKPPEGAGDPIPLDQVTDEDCAAPDSVDVPAEGGPEGFSLLTSQEQSELALLARQWAELDASGEPDRTDRLLDIAREMVASLVPGHCAPNLIGNK